MKFLIDECLSPSLAIIARERGFAESTHVIWLGLRSRQDWLHPGLICLNVAHGLMRLDVQRNLFEYALTTNGDADLAGHVLEVTLAADGTVRVERYASGTELGTLRADRRVRGRLRPAGTVRPCAKTWAMTLDSSIASTIADS